MRPQILAALLALTTAAPAWCQEPPIEPGSTTTQSIQFPGGSLAHFAEVLRRAGAAHGSPVNIVVPESASAVAVPAMELTSVSINVALRAVATILMPAVQMEVQQLEDQEDDLPVFAVAIYPVNQRPTTSLPPKQIGVLSLAALTAAARSDQDATAITPETALTAIETGLEVEGGPEVDIRFHTDSRLLFVRGQPEQVQLVEDILMRLERDREELRRLMAPRNIRQPAGTATTEPAPVDPEAPPTRRR